VNRIVSTIACRILLCGGILCGCTSPGSFLRRSANADQMARAEQLYQSQDYTAAMLVCIDIARNNPDIPGLPELQGKIMDRLNERRAEAAAIRNARTQTRMTVDIDSRKNLPETYGLQRNIRGETGPLRAPSTPMEQALNKPVTVHLEGVNINDFILAVGASENINIVADAMDAASTMTVHAEKVPLSEILDFVSRNLGVSFYVGENIIWATPRDQTEPSTPMATRMYRLRKGMSGKELAEGRETINIVDAVQRFIPERDGSDLLFDRKAHVLIAKNTRENLSRIEEIIEALDVCPPQILIEARFISTSVTDLRELGIDWVLNSNIDISRKTVLENNVPVNRPKTQIDAGGRVHYTGFPNASEGLNLSYQGILTDPMFRAVLHALQTSGKSQTLSVPKVTTVNNNPARIRIGEDFRYFEEYDVQSTPTTTSDGGSTIYTTVLVPSGSPQLEELGIQLDVTPSVGADMGDISLRIIPELSEFVRYEYYSVGSSSTATSSTGETNAFSLVKLPIFRRSKIETEMIVHSGETVVMGGLILSTESKKRSGVPILSSIPLLGRLFEHDSVEQSRQNLLIFVTANILSDRGENLVPISTAATESPAP